MSIRVDAAAIYCRLSYAPDGSLEKVDRQERLSRALADRLGWPVDEVLVDNSLSAWRRNVKRPAWRELLAGIESGRWRRVIVYHGDRLMRQPHDLEQLLTIADAKGVHLAAPSGTVNLDNPEDRFKLRIEVAMACREVDNLSRRMRDKMRDKAAAGAPMTGGRRPYGYRWTGGRLVQVPAEVRVVREVARRLISGQSIYGIVHGLNDRGIPTGEGGRWSTTKLRRLMERPRLAGLRDHHGEIVATGVWRPILDEDTWRAAVAAMRLRGESFAPAPRGPARYLVSGILRCGACKIPMYVRVRTTKEHGPASYGCPDCGRSVAQPHTDALVDDLMRAWLARKTAPVDLPPDDDLADEADALKARIKATLATFSDSLLSPVELRGVLEPLKSRLAEVEARMRAPAVPVVPAEAWPDAPVDRKRELVRAHLYLECGPRTARPRFTPERITHRWRGGPEAV